jgi:SAM-dependent methyltransferase
MSYFDHFYHSPGTPIGEWIKKRARQRIFNLISEFIPQNGCDILEIGPGMGELAECFRKGGYRSCVLVEPNSSMRNHLSRRGFITRNYVVPPIKEEDNSFDAIILVDVFEHLNDAQEASSFMVEAKRVLRPQGILCIHSPDYLHWKEDFFNGDYSHSNVTSVRRTMQLFHNNGFFTSRFVYFSGSLTGVFATITSLLAQFCFFMLSGNAIDSKLYKLKLTFLRQFLIIGLMEDNQNL